MLDKEYAHFQANRAELVKKYSGKYIVIVGDDVVGAYSSESEAYESTIKKYEVGKFLIQLCSEELPIQVFHSRVIF